MAWVKLDDTFFGNPKVIEAGRDARDLYIAGLCYCNRHLTDGLILVGALSRIAAEAEIKNARGCSERLVTVGLWEREDGGFRVHDYLEYQPRRERTLADRAATAKRQADWRERNRNGVSNGDITPLVTPSVTPTPSRPVPSRPVNNSSSH